ncbi:MAG: M56 family metallopeptidase [Lachnospiraceae bacterium]|nr:M56 family metallopeptidase [Lachnospiraceae bacterium]
MPVVLAVRFFLIKALHSPRRYVYYLWLFVFLNLCLPFSLNAPVSLVPEWLSNPAAFLSMETENGEETSASDENDDARAAGDMALAVDQITSLSSATGEAQEEENKENNVNTDVAAVSGFAGFCVRISELLQGNPRIGNLLNTVCRKAVNVAAVILSWSGLFEVWLTGLSLVLFYQGIVTFKMHRLLSAGRRTEGEERIYIVRNLPSPCLWGLFRPVICLPEGLKETERDYILCHERCHKKRGDHIVKWVLFLITAMHWFNPLVWLAYSFCCKDIEIACDEAVLRQAGEDVRKAYAASLLKYAARQNGYLFAPLTFGEPSLRSRVSNILHYRKQGAFVCGAALVIVLIVGAGLLLRTKNDGTVNAGETDAIEEIISGDADLDAMAQGDETTTEDNISIMEETGGAESLSVMNNGGEIILVGDQLYYLDGLMLYSDGNDLYYSSGSEEPYIYQHGLEGDSLQFRQLTAGSIVGSSDDGKILYYVLEGVLYAWEIETQESSLIWDIAKQGIEASEISCYFVGEDYILLAAGVYEGSAGLFSGSFYSYDRATGELSAASLTDSDSFAVMGEYLYYQKYTNGPGDENFLCRIDFGLTEEEVLSEDLTLVDVALSSGQVLALETSENGTCQNLILFDPESKETLVLVDMEYLLNEDLTGILSDWESAWESGDRISYTEVNVIGDLVYVYAAKWGYREGVSVGWRDALLEEAWLVTDSNGENLRRVTLTENTSQQEETSLAGTPCDPAALGWNMAEITDIRENFQTMSFTPEEASEDLTYLLGETERFILYGRGDYESMLVYDKETQSYAFIEESYVSNYKVLPELWEEDFDKDGTTELALKMNFKHGTGVYVDTLMIADPDAEGNLYVWEFLESDFTAEAKEHIAGERTDNGLLVTLDGGTSWEIRDHEAGDLAGGYVSPGIPVRVSVGSQMRFSVEDDEIVLTMNLEIWKEGDEAVTSDYGARSVTARVTYSDGGEFGLTDYCFTDI